MFDDDAEPCNVGEPFVEPIRNERSGKIVVNIGSVNTTCCIGSICIYCSVYVVRGVAPWRKENSVETVALQWRKCT